MDRIVASLAGLPDGRPDSMPWAKRTASASAARTHLRQHLTSLPAAPTSFPARAGRDARACRWRRSGGRGGASGGSRTCLPCACGTKRLARVRPGLHESSRWMSVCEGDGPREARNARRAMSIPTSPRSGLKTNFDMRTSEFLFLLG